MAFSKSNCVELGGVSSVAPALHGCYSPLVSYLGLRRIIQWRSGVMVIDLSSSRVDCGRNVLGYLWSLRCAAMRHDSLHDGIVHMRISQLPPRDTVAAPCPEA
jgi:hypothetical protein